MSKRLVQSTAVKGPTFDPNKNIPYRWEQDDIFEITGQQFASLYHALTQAVRNPGGAPMMLTYEAYNTVMNIFSIGVQQGIIVEQDGIPSAAEADGMVKNLFNKAE